MTRAANRFCCCDGLSRRKLLGTSLAGGQIVRSSDSKGGRPVESPYRLECVLAHMYRHLGIDPGLTFNDFNGRPRYLLEIRHRIAELG